MKRIFFSCALGMVIFLVLLLSPVVQAVNVGVSPATVSFQNVLRFGYAERDVLISADSSELLTVEASTWGDIADWITLSATSFDVSAQSPATLSIQVSPPSDIPNGNYTGFVRILTGGLGEGVEGHAVGVVRSSLDLAVHVQVSDVEHASCIASGFSVQSVEQGDDLIFSARVVNDGNIRLHPLLTVDIWDDDQTTLLGSFDTSSFEVLPTTEETLTLRVPSGTYDVSQYWADVSVVDCFSSEVLTFDVLEEGALKADGELLRILTREEAFVGETLPIEVTFKNTGEKELSAQFRGQVTKGGKLVQLLESPFSTVEINDFEKFMFYFTPSEAGRYVISGRVYYDGKKTFEKSMTFDIVGSSRSSSWIFGLIYFGLFVLIALLFFKIRKERKHYSRRLRGLP